VWVFPDGAERAQICKLVHRRFLPNGGAVHLLAIADNDDYGCERTLLWGLSFLFFSGRSTVTTSTRVR
jgi:hypothetical protein